MDTFGSCDPFCILNFLDQAYSLICLCACYAMPGTGATANCITAVRDAMTRMHPDVLLTPNSQLLNPKPLTRKCSTPNRKLQTLNPRC